MRLAYHTDFALRVLAYLAVRPGERVRTADIAAAHGLSTSHLHKVVRSLGDLDLVDVQRGVKGGAKLLLEPERISIGAVVRALDDPSGLVECLRPHDNACVISPACAIRDALRSAQEAFYDALMNLTLADVVAGRRAGTLRRLTGG